MYIIDIRDPRAADFPLATTGREFSLPDTVLGSVRFPEIAQGQTGVIAAVGDEAVYAVQRGVTINTALLHVIDIRDETQPQVVASLELPDRVASGVVLQGDLLYVAAGAAGLLVFDLHDPLHPVLLTSVAGDADPDDDLDITLTSRLTIDGEFVYVVQTHLERSSDRQTDLLTIFDLRDLRSPRQRGTVPLRVATAEPSTLVGSFRGTPFNMVIFVQGAWRSRRACRSDTRCAQEASSWDREDASDIATGSPMPPTPATHWQIP